jgi:hypothetical protein
VATEVHPARAGASDPDPGAGGTTGDALERATIAGATAAHPAQASGPGEAQPGTVVTVEVEQALGPGVDFERARTGGLVGRRVRTGGAWLGFDRAALVDSDDGNGRRLAVLVGLPASTFAGARLEVELIGGWSSPTGSVILVGRPQGSRTVPLLLARIAGDVDEQAVWFDRAAAERRARRARQRHRERQSHARIGGGRAWHPMGGLPPEIARFATPHSSAEYRLSRLPPRFLRGLEGLLDDDERVLYWVARPMLTDVSLVRRVLERIDRRAALLALTDRQLLWIVDHAQPDRYLSDWGVDVELVPIERALEVRCTAHDRTVDLTVVTRGGPRTYTLPGELADEAGVMRDLIARFTPAGGASLPRRRYPLDAIAFDPETASRFGQEPVARSLLQAARRDGDVLAFLFSPRRPGHRDPAAVVLRPTGVELTSDPRRGSVELDAVSAISLTLSPLVGRLDVGSTIAFAYPAPLLADGAAFARLARKALANLP